LSAVAEPEILVCGSDFNGGLAERYCDVNRAIADAEFIQVVDALDERVSPFDLIALADIKHLIHPETLPPNEGARPRNGRFLAGRRPPGDTGLDWPKHSTEVPAAQQRS